MWRRRSRVGRVEPIGVTQAAGRAHLLTELSWIGLGRIKRRVGKARPLNRGEVCLVLDVGKRDGQLSTRIHCAEKNVRDGVATLLPCHEIGDDRWHLGRPWSEDGTRNRQDNNRAGLCRRDLCDELVLVVDWQAVVKRERRAVGPLTTERSRKDYGDLGGRRKNRTRVDISPITVRNLAALANRDKENEDKYEEQAEDEKEKGETKNT